MSAFEYGFAATQGQRGYQEDSAVVWPAQAAAGTGPEATFDWNGAALPVTGSNGLVAILADGMGGHAGGALASKAVCESFIRTWVDGVAACAGEFGAAAPDMPAHMMTALTAGNDRIAAIVQGDPALSGMGSTLIGAIFATTGLQWISVGDSPLYLYRREEIALLNEDHSLAPALDKLAAEGRISAEQAKNDPRRHMLRSAITGEDLDLIDISRNPLSLQSGDYVILASDGIHTLDESELVRVISGYAVDGPRAVAEAIIRAIENARDPYQDNATVVVVRPVGS